MRNWQGKVVVDIREFYVKDGKQLPGRKGIDFFFVLVVTSIFGCLGFVNITPTVIFILIFFCICHYTFRHL